MRKFLLSLFFFGAAFSADAQTSVVSGFDTLYLSKTDTFYSNNSAHMTDLGFNDGLVHFSYYYDTAWGGFWSKGFAYSNMTDSLNGSFTNPYSARTGTGYKSANYAVYLQGTGGSKAAFTGAQSYKPQGFYITNSTYVYSTIKNGNFGARKFGDTTGTNSGLPQGNYPDWFKLTISGYHNGTVSDTVEFYLADYRFANDNYDYIIGSWVWVNLQKLGWTDSLGFELSSSDNHPQYGMNTPGYFCMDDLTVDGVSVGVNDISENISAKIYPNPASEKLFVDFTGKDISTVMLLDMSGKILAQYQPQNAKLTINVATLPAGVYLLQFNEGTRKQFVRFVKQ